MVAKGTRGNKAGSWDGRQVACRRAACCGLVTDGKKRSAVGSEYGKQEIMKQECETCKHERGMKALVAASAQDKRFVEPKFIKAPAIFANNDIKYETNKLRAKSYAATHALAMTYCPAKDMPSSEALRERPALPTQKLSWLQRHDRESGDLYGIVSLVKGMPVALTDHIDRSPDKQLLRGRVGEIHSWILGDGEGSIFEGGVRVLSKLPKLVLVRFRKANGEAVDWCLPGLEPGIYPITPKNGTWFLDKGRKQPVLKITRRQIPLAPAFAMTAHAAQGQTLTGGAIVDLCIGKGSNPLGSYVAMTRVKRGEDMLIYRPFPRDFFCERTLRRAGIAAQTFAR